MAKKRLAERTKNKMSNKMSKKALDIPENETEFSKKTKLGHKLISVTISNKHPEIDIDDHQIQNFLLIFNLLLQAELNKDNLNIDSEDGIPDILITIATDLLDFLHKNIDSLSLPKLINNGLKKLKSFVKG